MYYFDIGSQLVSQSLSSIRIKKKTSSGSLHDSGSFALEDSGEYIGSEQSQTNSHKFANQIAAMFNIQCLSKFRIEIVIFVAIICLLITFSPKAPAPLKVGDINGNQKYLHIISPSGSSFRLDYLKPEIIQPNRIQEPQLQILKMPNSLKFVQEAEKPNDPIQFNSKLFLNWMKGQQSIYQAEYYRYHKKYDLEKGIPQSWLCIISPFRNIVSSSSVSWKLFAQSINSQNYSNYHVYMIDDYSNDNSTEIILNEVKQKYPRLNNRLTIIRNYENKGALGNRDSTIRNHCKAGDIVVDIDGDDALIGKQVFNIVNRIYYKNKQAWFMYMNYLSVIGRVKGGARNFDLQQIMQPGICKPIKPQTFTTNSYRTRQRQWVTSQLRTYLRDLYVKIPLEYVLEQGSRSYFIEASDRFSMYALTELAGSNHTLYVEEYVYFYFEPNFLILEQKDCLLPLLFYNEAQARIMAPLLPLKQLNSSAQITPKYTVPDQIKYFYNKNLHEYLKCLSRLKHKEKP